MKYSRNNQPGFTLIEVLLIILVLIALVFTGYYVWHDQKSNNTLSTTLSTVNPYTGWNTYKDTSGLFSLKYPTDWTNDTVQAGTTVLQGPSQTSTTLSVNAQGELTPTAVHSQSGPDILSITSDSYSGTIQAYLAKNGPTSQNYSLTINGYQAEYGIETNNGGDTIRTYQVFYKGKVAILNFTLNTPSSFGGSPAQSFSQYSSVEDQIVRSIKFLN